MNKYAQHYFNAYANKIAENQEPGEAEYKADQKKQEDDQEASKAYSTNEEPRELEAKAPEDRTQAWKNLRSDGKDMINSVRRAYAPVKKVVNTVNGGFDKYNKFISRFKKPGGSVMQAPAAKPAPAVKP